MNIEHWDDIILQLNYLNIIHYKNIDNFLLGGRKSNIAYTEYTEI